MLKIIAKNDTSKKGLIVTLFFYVFLFSPNALPQNFHYASDQNFKESIVKYYPVGSDVTKLIEHLTSIGMTQEKNTIALARLNRGITEGVDFHQPISEEEVSKYYNKNLYRFNYRGSHFFWKIQAYIAFYKSDKDNSIKEYYRISRIHHK